MRVASLTHTLHAAQRLSKGERTRQISRAQRIYLQPKTIAGVDALESSNLECAILCFFCLLRTSSNIHFICSFVSRKTQGNSMCRHDADLRRSHK